MSDPLLEVEDLHAGYGKTTVLEGVSLSVPEESVVSLVGRNGAGKTTTLRAITGHVDVTAGSVRLGGEDVTGLDPETIYRKGIGLVPENREVFPGLTVEENLKMGATTTDEGWLTFEEAYDLFPRLGDRKAQLGRTLSGGEQQMLAIARSLMGDTEVLLLDEPTEGLAPQIVDDIVAIIEKLADRGLTVLIVEQNIEAVTAVADYHHVLANGQVVFEGSTDDLSDARDVQERYLGVSQSR
ncbi:ABC transporter ATP-binding protein [Halobacteriales archaeon Cl-PHB]